MDCRLCGNEFDGGMDARSICPTCSINDPTLTLWIESISPNASAEDSIRSPRASTLVLDSKSLPFRSLRKEVDGSSGKVADYALGERLGSGGMGDVFSASQTSFRRQVAIKMARKSQADSQTMTDALLAEAIVTGNLDHPNVVPVHDLCIDEEGNVFFVMKEVRGCPWANVIPEKSLDDNLDILLRVADAIAFAHSKGILHRDLKPHNIMIGEFGEIMVMDWGASCSFKGVPAAGARSAELSFCGTPAYMPPEMAKGDANRLGGGSDVYLLGALLYHILTGHPPRREKNPVQCLTLAMENHIEPFDQDGELQQIALTAMATAPSDRYADVKSFQQAVRNYRMHSQGLRLIALAKGNLARARENQDYELFNRAIYGLGQAGELWQDNADIRALLNQAQVAYARCAMANADYELAQSLLDPENPTHAQLLDLIRKALRDRDAHAKRNKRLKFSFWMLVLVLLLFFAAAFFVVRAEKQETELQRERASAAHRSSLITLISAQYQAKEYEAATQAFWELNDEYGMNGLDRETLLDIRISAAMNPWRGAIELGMDEVLGMVPAHQKGYIWAIGKNKLLKVELDCKSGWADDSMVSIYDYSFGKRKSPGHIAQTIHLPFELANAGAFFEAGDGALWMGSGSSIYRYDAVSSEWNNIIDVSALDIPPLSENLGLEEGNIVKHFEWMKGEGRAQPITGIILTEDETHAGVALGGGAVCWIDLVGGQMIGWMHANLFIGQLGFKEARHPVLMKLSTDESHLCYVDGVLGTIQVILGLPDFHAVAMLYDREYRILDYVFHGKTELTSIASESLAYRVNQQVYDSYRWTGAKKIHWIPNDYALRTFDDKRLTQGSMNRAGGRLCVLSDDKILYAGPSEDTNDYEIRRAIVRRSYQYSCLTEDGYMLLMDSAARLHVYDMHTYSLASVEIPGCSFDHLCSGERPEWIHFTSNNNGNTSIRTLDVTDVAHPRISDHGSIDGEPIDLCFDPHSRFFAFSRLKAGKAGEVDRMRTLYVHDLEENEQLASFDTARCSHIWFSEDGEFLVSGGNWSQGLDVISTQTWEPSCTMPSGADGGYIAACLDQRKTPPKIITAGTSDWKLSSHNLGMPNDGFNTNWVDKTSGVTLSIIPFSNPDSGKDLYWCRTWFGDFEAHDVEEGKLADHSNNYWHKKALGSVIFKSFYSKVVMPMEDGSVQLCGKTDMYPVFDSRVLPFKTRYAVLSSDASLLYLHGDDDKLHVMKLPPAANL